MNLTASATKHLVKAIKAAIRVNDKVARDIINDNWLSSITGNLRYAVITVNPESRQLDVFTPATDDAFEGYHVISGWLKVTDAQLKRWNALPIEEAYALPEGVVIANETMSFDGKVTGYRAKDDDGIIVTVLNFATGKETDMVLLADINDAPGLIDYAAGIKGEPARIIYEPKAAGRRARISGGRPVLENVLPGENRMNENGEEVDDFMDLDDYFGPVPEFA